MEELSREELEHEIHQLRNQLHELKSVLFVMGKKQEEVAADADRKAREHCAKIAEMFYDFIVANRIRSTIKE
jgi:hypothetical protein